jgi:hypothetical protein
MTRPKPDGCTIFGDIKSPTAKLIHRRRWRLPAYGTTDDGLTTNAGIYTVRLDVSGVVTNLTLGAGEGAGSVQMFASNADSHCTSFAGA